MFLIAYELLRHTFGVLDVASGEPMAEGPSSVCVGKAQEAASSQA